MSAVTKDKQTGDRFLAQFEQLEKELTAHDAPWLRRIRKAAIARYAELGPPGPRNEDWKFTNVTPIVTEAFAPFTQSDLKRFYRRSAMRLPEPVNAYQIGFINGHFADALATEPPPPGVTVASLATMLKQDPQRWEPHLARVARFEDHAFTALNTAFLGDGALVHVPKGVVLDKPIHLFFLATMPEGPVVCHPRTLVVLDENSQATVIESFHGANGQRYFTNAVSEIVLAQHAVVDHYKVQREANGGVHVANTSVRQAQGSRFSTHYVGLGGSLVRNEVRVTFTGEHAEATVNGVYRAGDKQHVDNHTVIDHAQPNCASHELYKGILDGQARGVFNGKIFVRQDAQKTDAKQTNQTLLLSEDATINTKPQLEIFADDVKCTHGATVGQLDDEALFYLRSRGLGLEEARSLLIHAFANDVVSRIQVPELRDQLEAMLLNGRDAS